ncbi:MAG: nitroreductase family protein [Chloroflexota bacterium]
MDVETAIERLRVVRVFEERPLAANDLAAILNAGRRAGSSKNQQRRAFVVVTERARLSALRAVGPFAGHLAGAAAAVALVTPDPDLPDQPHSVLWDLGLAAQNMILVAWSRGIGSCPATVYDADLARRLLDLPGGMACEYLLSFGYPADPADLARPPRSGGRRPLKDIVHHERW